MSDLDGCTAPRRGVAIRTGHHCAQPVWERFGIPGTARAALGIYNHRGDVDALVCALGAVKETLA